MKKILIPTDFSENAGDALDYALNFIGNSKAELHIVNVVNNTTVNGDMVVVSDDPFGVRLEQAQNSMELLEKFGNKYFKDNDKNNVKISTKVIYGSITEDLKTEALLFKADLIIMGTQGVNHGALDRFFGSVSTRIVNDSPCPVLLIPRGYKFKPIDDVLFTTTLNHSEPFELYKAMELIKPNEAVLRCLHVTKTKGADDFDETEKFSKYLMEHTPALQTIFYKEVGENIEDIIKDYSETYDVEIIIMCKSKKGFLDNLLGRSHTKSMIHLSKMPLLVMN